MEFLRHFQSCKELKQNNLFYIGENLDLKAGDLHAQIHVDTAYGENVQVKEEQKQEQPKEKTEQKK